MYKHIYPLIPLVLYILINTILKFWSTGLLANIICVFVTSMGVVNAAAIPPIKHTNTNTKNLV